MKFFYEQIATPLIRRVGSVGAGVALTYGVTASEATAIELAIVAIGGIGIDLVNSYKNRNN